MQSKKIFYICKCYFSHNIYVKEYDHHFNYFNDENFNKDYNNILPSIGCDNAANKSALLKKIMIEIDFRKGKEERDAKRKLFLQLFYQPFDKNVYLLKKNYLHPTFLMLIKDMQQSIRHEIFQFIDTISFDKQIYSFPVFTEDFCKSLLNELDHYNNSDMPKERPNTMNNQGILLDDIGFHDNFSLILREHLDLLVENLFPIWRGEKLDSHRIFTVQYNNREESQLSYHYDNSEVTLNVCLGRSFQGGEIYFGDMKSTPISESSCILVPHKIGYGLLHRGQQLHGTLPVTEGERCNLIMWMRSSSVRNQICSMCNSKPSNLIPALHYGDGFTLDNIKQNASCYLS